jgi:nitrite reductase/ring-hydroxylating ferredoxin subunit
MERKAFIKSCGFACLGLALPGLLLEGCAGSKTTAGVMDKSGMTAPLSAFDEGKGEYRQYIIVQHEQLKYPVCVFRFSDTEYTALLMKCTHQGAELQVFGDRLECPAHGSQFSDRGVVKNGPADSNLRTFPVTVQHDQIHITLT